MKKRAMTSLLFAAVLLLAGCKKPTIQNGEGVLIATPAPERTEQEQNTENQASVTPSGIDTMPGLTPIVVAPGGTTDGTDTEPTTGVQPTTEPTQVPTQQPTVAVTPTPAEQPTVAVTNTPTPTITGAAQSWQITEQEPIRMVTTATVNVRRTPELDGEWMDQYAAGKQIVVTGRNELWYRIEFEGGEAYVYAQFVAALQETEPTPEITGTPAKLETGLPGTNIAYLFYEDAPVVVVDAGHQAKGNSEKEPLGPGSSELKSKVSSGTSGKWTKVSEYQLNLMVAMKVKEALLQKGINVIMIRETNDVNISNAERASIANAAEADAFVRIHADGGDNPQTNGMMTICPTAKNPYCSEIYSESYRLSNCILQHMLTETGANDRGIWQTDTMSGINWCEVPVTIVEMGFMTNEREDRLMATEEYQDKLARGIVAGILDFLENR